MHPNITFFPERLGGWILYQAQSMTCGSMKSSSSVMDVLVCIFYVVLKKAVVLISANFCADAEREGGGLNLARLSRGKAYYFINNKYASS